MKMSAAKVVHVITGLQDGGAEASLAKLCINDSECLHTVISLTDEGKYGKSLREAGVKIYTLHMRPYRLNLIPSMRLIIYLRKIRPDVVQTWMYHANLIGGIYARLVGIRNVYWGLRQDRLTTDFTKRSTRYISQICALMSRWVPKMIISCSHRASASHQAIGYASNKMTVVANGYDLKKFQPDLSCTKNQNLDVQKIKKPTLGMVGRYAAQKDHANLFRALHLLKTRKIGFHCVLIGTHMDKNNEPLVKTIKKEGLSENVTLLGPQEDIPSIMKKLDLHVLSSFSEGFPNVLAEAMACGTPCVATDVGDASLIVGETGWIVPPRDSEALATAIEKALKCRADTSAWQLKKRLCRERIIAHFQLSTMIENYHRVWSCDQEISGKSDL